MVSLRRRRLLGLSSVNTSFAPQLPTNREILADYENSSQHYKFQSDQPVLSDIASVPDSNAIVKDEPGPSNVSGSNSYKEKPSQESKDRPVKRRKLQARKPIGNQEPFLLKGVYFKSMKWEAAIKVNYKQIHLGVFGSKEEAAHLYDRAAFVIGRGPNFELPEEEKKELRRYTWEEFLATTREARRKRLRDSHNKKSAD